MPWAGGALGVGQVPLELVEKPGQLLVGGVEGLAAQAREEGQVARRRRRRDGRQAAGVEGEAQHVDRRFEEGRVDAVGEEAGRVVGG